MKELEAFEAWWIAQETGLGTAHKFTAWNAWLARSAVEADRAQRVPDWAHPKVQALIGSDARKRIQIDLMWRILENPNDEFGPSDMEYWDTIHDRLKSALLASTPAPAQQSGWTEESGLVIDFANRVELSCYDQGSAECMAAVQEILDGKDRGDGVANEPWESIRRRLISLVAPAPAQPQSLPDAMQTVITAMQADPGYAWSWHCNVAMAMVDSGCDPVKANQGAARFMRTLANVEPAHELPSAPAQQERKPMTDEIVRLAGVVLNEMPHPVTNWQSAAKKVCEAVAAIKEQT